MKSTRPPPAWEPTQEDIDFVSLVVRRFLPTVPAEARQDVVQEVLVQASFSPPPDGVDIRRWLFGIAENVAHNYVRNEKRWRTLARRAIEAAPEDEVPTPQDEMERAERRKVITACLRTLAPAVRELVFGHFGEDRSVPELAGELGMNVHTGYSRTRQGKEDLASAWRRHLARNRIKKGELAVPAALLFRRHGEEAVSSEQAVSGAEPVAPRLLASRIGKLRRAASAAGRVGLWLLGAAAAVAVVGLRPGLAASDGAIGPERAALSLAAVPAEHAPAESRGAVSPPAISPGAAAPVAGSPPEALRARPHAPWRSTEAAWVIHIKALRRRGALREAAAETAAFQRAYHYCMKFGPSRCPVRGGGHGLPAGRSRRAAPQGLLRQDRGLSA